MEFIDVANIIDGEGMQLTAVLLFIWRRQEKHLRMAWHHGVLPVHEYACKKVSRPYREPAEA